MKKGRKFVSVRTRITLMTLTMVAVSVAAISLFGYYSYRKDSINLQGHTALAVANTLASAIDAEGFANVAATAEANEYFIHTRNLFDATKENTGLLYLYAMVKSDDGLNYKYVYVTMGEEHGELGVLEPIEHYGEPPLEVYRTGEGAISGIYQNGEHGHMISGFAPITDANGNVIGLVGADISADDVINSLAGYRNRVIIAAMLAGILVAIIAGFYTNRSLGRPIKALAQLAERIVQGELDVQVYIKTNDEIQLLADNFLHIRDTLNTLIVGIHKMSEVHLNGQLDYFIDSSQFTGVYRVLIEETNAMVKEYIDNVWEMLGTLNGFGKGDFSIALRDFPGQKAYANEAVEALRTIFNGLSSEIGTLAVSSVNGDLSNKIDTGKYEGNWRFLTEQLNKLLEAIRSPISESVSVLGKMAGGDFSARVKGDYKGDFSLIKSSLNDTMDKISSYISEISDVLSKMSEQNLTTDIDREYVGDFGRIKDSINLIIEKFNDVLSEINASAERVAIGAKQISDLSVSLAQGSSEQASATEELSASAKQIAIQTDSNSDTANRANELAASARQNVKAGNDEMKTMIVAMEEISESASSISRIIKTIDDIAFQTNLLALNAAIEAARAGVHGKGFAVVAEEVRSLAGRSKIAAQETSALIEDSINKASEGMRVSDEMAKSLEIIVSQISEVSEQINEIAESSREQSINIGRINQGITQITEVTLSNSTLSEESAASSEELSRQADMFRKEVSKFELKTEV